MKKTISLITLLSIPMISFADLTITNNTNLDSTSIINRGLCSATLPTGGVTKAHTTNVISSFNLGLACVRDQRNCKADVYMTNNCTGPIIATVILDTKTGIKSVEMKDENYTITADKFKVVLSGGPA